MSREKNVFLNEEIRSAEVRCIGDDGTVYGVISREEALGHARRLGVDLVLVSADAKPPVCKLMDYSKFKYQQEKKLKEAKKKQKAVEVKEIKFSCKIAQNDIDYKVKHAREFLSEGKHVKFRVFLRGRELNSPEVGVKTLVKVWDLVKDVGERQNDPALEGRYINMLVVPKK